MIWMVLASLTLLLSLLPAAMVAGNLRLFRRAPRLEPSSPAGDLPAVSVLIPARNEEASIEACLRSVLASTGVQLQVIVLDDRSTDRTAQIVRSIAGEDARVQLHEAPPLPEGWCGKQHACHILSTLATHERLLWIDADVRLSPDALARTLAFMLESGAPLVSGFPRQETRTWSEKLIVPLIHLVLLGYLPLFRMRVDLAPSLAAGCGQLFLADRAAYQQAGGHQAIRTSLHDGVTLPRNFRKHGFKTDLFDAHDIARCRMYHSLPAVWNGFAKNATEGMASPVGIWVWTVLLMGGHVLPWIMAVASWPLIFPLEAVWVWVWAWVAIILACGLSLASSALVYVRFEQPTLALLLRPFAVVMMLAIQWYAFVRQCVGRPVAWRGRSYSRRAAIPVTLQPEHSP